jgi:hypothetical protein
MPADDTVRLLLASIFLIDAFCCFLILYCRGDDPIYFFCYIVNTPCEGGIVLGKGRSRVWGFEIPIPKLRWKVIGWGREEEMARKCLKACWIGKQGFNDQVFPWLFWATERAWLADRSCWLVVCPHHLAVEKKSKGGGGLSISVANGNWKRVGRGGVDPCVDLCSCSS